MQEIEVKVLEIDVEDIKKKLGSLGASFKGTYDIIAWYFDAKGVVLRLRKKGNDCEFTLKKDIKKRRFKEAVEYNVMVDSCKDMKDILEMLGYNVAFEIEKKREVFSLLGCEITIDYIEGLPPFMEIEGNRDNIEKILALLNIPKTNVKSFDVLDVFRFYGKNIKL